ncbi:MAG: hypothetical protein JRJ47_13075 [Deltaproteobacteria bacterium]|nr:hypothetical protein [Deltaproteobacteria bacterium]
MKKILISALLVFVALSLTPIAANSAPPAWVLLETFAVDADGTVATSTETLVDGWLYRFEVSGRYSAGANITADAEYSSGPDSYAWDDFVEKYEVHGECLLELTVDGGCVEWGPYDPEHVYTMDYTGAGSTVDFQIYDIYSPNNTGSLTVKIYAQPLKVSTAIISGESEVGVGAEESWDIEITFEAMYADVEDVIVQDGMGADLDEIELDDTAVERDAYNVPVNTGTADLVKSGKGKMGSSLVIWDVGDLLDGQSATLVVTVTTGFNAKRKHSFTSAEDDHALDGGASATYWYDELEYETPETTPLTVDVVPPRLYLYEKHGDWNIVTDGAWGLLYYNFRGHTFDFDFTGNELEFGVAYSLIYYPEPQTTWPWPVTVIANGTSDGSGNLALTGSNDFDHDLNNAKIWLVLTDDIVGGSLSGWQPARYLFEHNLITYYNK